jgi:CRP/FNR family transcriptional regulator
LEASDDELRLSRSVRTEEKPGTIPVFCPSVQGGAELIADLPAPQSVETGTVLAKQDQKESQVRLIRSGMVKLTYLSPEGEEFILGLRAEGWWMGAAQVLLDVPNMFNVLAMTSCSVSSIPADDFSQQLMKNPRMLRHYLSSACREKVAETKLHIMLLSSNAERRLRYMLDEHYNSVWKTLDPTAIMRQADVARLLAITPEHLSRVLHKNHHNGK